PVLLDIVPLCLSIHACQSSILYLFIFFFTITPTTETYTLSLHDALPIFDCSTARRPPDQSSAGEPGDPGRHLLRHRRDHPRLDADRKSTRLNSSHVKISYAVFCLKKKKKVINSNNRWMLTRYKSQSYADS